MRNATLWTALLGFAAPAAAAAQDFGTQWVDRVTHQLIQDEGALSPLPVHLKASGGELYSYDTNIFLTDKNRKADSIFTTFGQAALQYAQADFDAEADLTVNYNAYLHHEDSSSDEERFFGRARYQGSNVSVSLAQVLRRESSPADVVFVDRVQRLLSNTTPLVVWRATEVVAFELQSDLQVVKFHRSEFQSADNVNTRTALTAAYKTEWHDVEALLQGGFLTINYNESLSTDATGFYARAGGRGELAPDLHAIALVGVTRADSDDFAGTSISAELTTMDIEVHLAYTLTERSTAYADYSRRIGFSAGGASFQVIDSSGLSGEISLREDVKIRGRLQYDRVHGPFVVTRSYASASVGAEYRLHEHVIIDGGVTYRAGAALLPGGGGDFVDVIVSVGVAVVFN